MNLANLNPSTWAARLVAGGLFVAFLIGGGFVWGHHVGSLDVAALKAQYTAQTAQVNADAEKRYNLAAQQSIDREHALQAQLAILDSQRQQDKTAYETALSDLRTRALAGDVRLRATVAARAIPQCAAPASAAPAGRPGDTESADLVPTTVDAILGIAGRVAQDVRDYNALLGRYNAAVAMCNEAAP